MTTARGYGFESLKIHMVGEGEYRAVDKLCGMMKDEERDERRGVVKPCLYVFQDEIVWFLLL